MRIATDGSRERFVVDARDAHATRAIACFRASSSFSCAIVDACAWRPIDAFAIARRDRAENFFCKAVDTSPTRD
jgi:hypothetical protein